MIKINLLPPEATKRTGPSKAFKIPTGGVAPYLVALGIIYLGAAYATYVVHQSGVKSTRAMLEQKAKRDKKEKEVAKAKQEIKDLTAQSDEIDQKFRVVKAMNPENRLFWSEKLNMLACARLDLAVYITQLVLEERIEEKETAASKRAREEFDKRKVKKPTDKAPGIKKMPVIKQKLTINAVAYGNDSPQRLRQITAFSEMLTNLKWTRQSGKEVKFIDGIESEFGQVGHRMSKIGGVDVMRFGLICNAKPQEEEEDQQPAEQQKKDATAGGAKK